jgi:hypothetical protein
MKIAIYVLILLLLAWFWGCVVSYKTTKWDLVDGNGINGAEFKWWLIYLICCLSFVFFEPIGKWLLPVFLLTWLVIQFVCHWYFTIFGVSEQKLKGYNECFKNTIHIVPASNKHLVPDLYHILMHSMILALLVLCVINLF